MTEQQMHENQVMARTLAHWLHGTADALAPSPSGRNRLLADVSETPQRSHRWLPQSPKWRSQSMFSATKFVLAGVIVALFGGFLLISQSFQRQADGIPGAATGGPGTFSPAGSPGKARWFHTATLLPDGRVLVIGGWGGEDPLGSAGSAEVWDPQTDSFSPTGSPAEPRMEHTATLLHEGRVLVVGGARPDGEMLTSAEIWDPETDRFTPAGTLAEAHGNHTASLLPDGRVLIVGGYRRYQHYAETAEVWDPDTESFGPAELLAATRFYHTATLLPDGRVLIVGGDGVGDTALIVDPHAEVWDPFTASSSPAGSLAEGRMQHTATLLPDGRVLMVGGVQSGSGHPGTTVAEVWDPVTASFDPAGSPLVEALRGHTATLLSDGRVLVAGGDSRSNDQYTAYAAAEIWDPVSASFSPAGSLAEGRAYHTATLLPDGRVLVVGGGIDGVGPVTSAEVWEPSDG